MERYSLMGYCVDVAMRTLSDAGREVVTLQPLPEGRLKIEIALPDGDWRDSAERLVENVIRHLHRHDLPAKGERSALVSGDAAAWDLHLVRYGVNRVPLPMRLSCDRLGNVGAEARVFRIDLG